MYLNRKKWQPTPSTTHSSRSTVDRARQQIDSQGRDVFIHTCDIIFCKRTTL